MRIDKSLALVPFFALAFACGGSGSPSSSGGGSPVKDKQGAASAAYGLKQTGDGVRSMSARGLRAQGTGIEGLPGTGGDVSNTITVQGMHGTAILTEMADISGAGAGSVSAEFTIQYQQFSADGVNTYDGKVTHIVKVSGATGVGGEVSTELQGTVDVSGKVASHLDMDVSVIVDGGAAGASIKMQGFVSADSTRFDYNGDSFDTSAL
jgi:hypothetical protein